MVLQALRWNIHERADEISEEIEDEAPNYSRIAELADQLKALSAAGDKLEASELPETYRRCGVELRLLDAGPNDG